MTTVIAMADNAVRATDRRNKKVIFSNVHYLPTT